MPGIAGDEASPLGEQVALFQFDACDSLDQCLGAKKSAANWAARLRHRGNVDANKSAQLGMPSNPRVDQRAICR